MNKYLTFTLLAVRMIIIINGEENSAFIARKDSFEIWGY
jgi:hypothetical protein